MKDWDSELEDDQTTQTENGEYLGTTYVTCHPDEIELLSYF